MQVKEQPTMQEKQQRLLIFHPETIIQHRERDAIITQALRPEPLPFKVTSEYPLVLSEAGSALSYCAAWRDDPMQQIHAHANLWPRQLLSHTRQVMNVGLIGNVATSESQRGQGLMSELMAHLMEHGRQLGLKLLILWSDLDKFYQRLGFSSLGRELRYTFTASRMRTWQNHDTSAWHLVKASTLQPVDIATLLTCRPQLPFTLGRTAHEFATLLTIPRTDLYVQRRRDGSICGYLILGKGYDMVGVVHEWGTPTPAALLHGVQTVLKVGDWSQIMLLCPVTLLPSWFELLQKYALKIEPKSMALGRFLAASANPEPLTAVQQQLQAELFIWGLDSI